MKLCLVTDLNLDQTDQCCGQIYQHKRKTKIYILLQHIFHIPTCMLFIFYPSWFGQTSMTSLQTWRWRTSQTRYTTRTEHRMSTRTVVTVVRYTATTRRLTAWRRPVPAKPRTPVRHNLLEQQRISNRHLCRLSVHCRPSDFHFPPRRWAPVLQNQSAVTIRLSAVSWAVLILFIKFPLAAALYRCDVIITGQRRREEMLSGLRKRTFLPEIVVVEIFEENESHMLEVGDQWTRK